MYWYQTGYCTIHRKEMDHDLLTNEFICIECEKEKANV